MNKKEKQKIKYLLENLKWYSEATNEQDYNGEYEPPMEWEQGEAKIFLKYLKEKDKEIKKLKKEKLDLFNKGVELNLNIREKRDKEIERLNNIIKQIYKIFEEGRFEDNCDCIQIEELITRELKGSDK